MPRQALLRSPPVNRTSAHSFSGETTPAPQTLRTDRKAGGTKTNRFGEMAGGTAAECAAVCCCCPCTVMNLLVLAVIKVPASLCRKAKQRQRMMKRKRKESLLAPPSNGGSREALEREVRQVVEKGNHVDGDGDGNGDGEKAAVDLEKEMWDRFYGTGFWRSPSQRGT